MLGVSPALADAGPMMPSYNAVEAAIGGQGVALADNVTAAAALLDGRLVRPFPTIDAEVAYYFVSPDGRKQSSHGRGASRTGFTRRWWRPRSVSRRFSRQIPRIASSTASQSGALALRGAECGDQHCIRIGKSQKAHGLASSFPRIAMQTRGSDGPASEGSFALRLVSPLPGAAVTQPIMRPIVMEPVR